MNVCVLIMATNKEPSISNVEAMKDSFIRYAVEAQKAGQLEHNYDFVVYYANDRENALTDGILGHRAEDGGEHIINFEMECHESVYMTYEKTYTVLKSVTHEYDWYIRINISCFLNIALIDRCLKYLKPDMVYGNAINTFVNADSPYVNDIYMRGDLIMFSESTRKGIVEHGEKYMFCDRADRNRLEIPHVDDCLLGVVMIDYFGKDYYTHLRMFNYNFLCRGTDEITKDNIHPFAVGSRVKTVPPNQNYSGYSWDDNEYRRIDCEKMRLLQKFYEENYDYKKFNKIDLFVKKDASRPTLFIETYQAKVDDIKEQYLSKKRG